MTDILIGTHSRNSWQRPGTTATLRIWFSGEFRDTNGVMVTPGNGTSSFYQIVPCTVNPTTHVVTIPPFTLPSTLDGTPATVLSYGRLYDEGGAPREFLWTGWSLSNLPTSLPFNSWFIFNQGSSLSNPPDFYLNRQEVIALIDSLLGLASQGILSEIPVGVIDGVNATFALSQTPVTGSLQLFLNGQLQQETVDYTLSGAVITFVVPPLPGDWLFAFFRTTSVFLAAPSLASLTNIGISSLSAAPINGLLPVAVGNNDPRVIDVSSYASFAAALTAIGTTPTTFNIHTAITGIATGTVPATVTLRFLQGGSLTVATGQTLTILGPITAEPIRIFYGPGIVSFAGNLIIDTIQSAWWGTCGAKTSAAIGTTFTRTSGSTAAGATTVVVDSGTSFANGDTIKITGAGPSGAVYRGIIVSGGGTTSWTVYPATHTIVADDSSIHHGDNNITTKTSGSLLAGATAIAVADATSFEVGQGIYIAGAGAASGASFLPFIGEIASVLVNTITLTAGITTGVSANALVMHDETAAFAKVVAAATTAKCCTIIIPPGVFMVNGPGTGTQLGRIQLPTITNIADRITLRFQGAPRTIPTFPAFLANHGITTHGTIIQSDGAAGSIIAGSDGANFTGIDGQFFDITIRAYDNPKINGLNGRLFAFLRIENCMFDTATQAGAVTQPTDTTNFAFATGATANGGQEVIRNVWSIGGWYSGMELGEHAVLEGDIESFGNFYGARLSSAKHPIYIGRLSVHQCTRSIGILSPLRLKIGALVLERRWSTSPLPTWLNTQYDIDDASNFGAGEVAYSTYIGSDDSFISSLKVNGARDVVYYPVSTGKITNFGRVFSDNFEDNSTESYWWTVGSQTVVGGSLHGTVIEQNQRLEVTPETSLAGIRYRGYVTKDTFDLTGMAVTVQVPQVATNGAVTVLILQKDASNKYTMAVSGTTITFSRIVNGTPTTIATDTYSAVNHLWWRIVESVDYLITAQVSTNGTTWVTLGTDAGFRMYFLQMRISLEAGTESSIAVPGVAHFDNFSIAAP